MPFPTQIPTLVFSGGLDADLYAKEAVVRGWVEEKNEERAHADGSPIVGISCSHSMHEMDNELPEYGAIEVRNSAAEFAREVAAGTVTGFMAGDNTFGTICKKL